MPLFFSLANLSSPFVCGTSCPRCSHHHPLHAALQQTFEMEMTCNGILARNNFTFPSLHECQRTFPTNRFAPPCYPTRLAYPPFPPSPMSLPSSHLLTAFFSLSPSPPPRLSGRACPHPGCPVPCCQAQHPAAGGGGRRGGARQRGGRQQRRSERDHPV